MDTNKPVPANDFARELDRKLTDAMLSVDSRPLDDEPYQSLEHLQIELAVKQTLLKATLDRFYEMAKLATIYRADAKYYKECVHWSLLGNAVIAIIAAIAVLLVKAGRL